jgi:hypothetical protein
VNVELRNSEHDPSDPDDDYRMDRPSPVLFLAQKLADIILPAMSAVDRAPVTVRSASKP